MDRLTKTLGWLSLLYAPAFLAGALLHAGVRLGPLSTPPVPPAVVVETLCGLAMLAAGYGVLTGRPWAREGVAYAHAGTLAGVLLGIVATALVPGSDTPLTSWYHSVMAAALALGLGVVLYSSRARR
ncbi:hypothetical protein [Thermoactinospora rubra]|uniref:hypothetical protein n=1 Tax=Thermoactinospora rubra TaxID=1088767 RepID=UPI000A0FA1E5|nr:hypothetical protein [Thermoactinospora rubra]